MQDQRVSREMASTDFNGAMTWCRWLRIGGQKIASELCRIGRTLRWVRSRIKQRRELSRLDDRTLHDIGVTRVQAQEEASKPFWK